MQLNVRVQVDRPDEYVGKSGLVKNQVITCQDMDPTGIRLVNTFDYTLTEDEKEKYAGKLLDKEILLGVYELIPLGGSCDVTLSESILRVVEGRRLIGQRRRPALRRAE